MDVVARAPELLKDLLPDGGQALLRDGQLGETWAEALTHVPPRVLRVKDTPRAGLVQLARLRDFWAASDLRPALAATRALHQLQVRAGGPSSVGALSELGALGALVRRAGRGPEGGAMLEEAWAGIRRVAKPSDLRLAIVGANVALWWIHQGELERAEEALSIAYEVRKRRAPETLAITAAQLGELHLRQDAPEVALPLLREAWELSKARLGADHPQTINRAWTLGTVYSQLERYAQAVRQLQPVFDALKQEPMGERLASLAFELGLAHAHAGNKEAGQRLVEVSVRWTRGAGGPHPALPNRLSQLAQIQLDRGRAEEAEGIQMEALEAERVLYGDQSVEVAERYTSLGVYMSQQGRVHEALGWLEPAASLYRTLLGDTNIRTKAAVTLLAGLLIGQASEAKGRGDRGTARELLRAAWELASPVLGPSHNTVRELKRLRQET